MQGMDPKVPKCRLDAELQEEMQSAVVRGLCLLVIEQYQSLAIGGVSLTDLKFSH